MAAHILHLLSKDLPTGTVKQIELLCKGLGKCGFEQSICSFEPNRQRRTNLPRFAERISFCSHNWQLDPTFLLRLRRRLGRWNPALIQTWGGTAGNIGVLLAAVLGGIPTVRSIGSFERLSFLDCWWSRQAKRIVVNNDLLKPMLAHRGVPSHSIEMIVNAIEPSRASSAVRSLHQELRVGDLTKFVAVLADLRHTKRIKDLIWAMDLLRVIHPEIHLLVIGEGEASERLKKFDRDVSLDHCIHFLGRRSDVSELLSQCFCFWQPSSDEGCSTAMLEAMSMGLPVVAADTVGHKSLVVHGETGYLVPLEDCTEFARKTNWLLQNEQRRQEMGNAGHRLVNQRHAVQPMIDGYNRIYVSVLEGRSGHAA